MALVLVRLMNLVKEDEDSVAEGWDRMHLAEVEGWDRMHLAEEG